MTDPFSFRPQVNSSRDFLDRQGRFISYTRRYPQLGRVAFGSQGQIALQQPNPPKLLSNDPFGFGLGGFAMQLAGMVLAELAVVPENSGQKMKRGIRATSAGT